MKYAVLDNTKRNRNIGTAKQGYGRNNKFSIPQPSDTGLYFYERLQGISIEIIKVHGKNITVILEDLNKDFYYSFSPEEAQQILNNLPEEDLIGLGYLIFRQPKRKELILSRAWGRLIYSFEFQNVRSPAIIMEAIENTLTLSFPKKQSVELNLEFELLKKDGLCFTLEKREHIAEIDKEKMKSIQIRTLLHEIGHYVHFLEVVERPGNEDEEHELWEERNDSYFSIPVYNKEIVANKYAMKHKSRLKQIGII